MLLRMYMRWARAQGLQDRGARPAGRRRGRHQERHHRHRGRVGLRLAARRGGRAPAGAHLARSTRNARRHTSFASVFVYPDIDETIKVEIDDKDLRIDVMRSGGAGGQHVNKTESAVRVTHMPDRHRRALPDGERSQHKNKSTAMRILRSKLFEVEQKKQEEKMGDIHAQKKAIEWGSQIRSYVLAPVPAGHRPPHRDQGRQRRRGAGRRSRSVHGRDAAGAGRRSDRRTAVPKRRRRSRR